MGVAPIGELDARAVALNVVASIRNAPLVSLPVDRLDAKDVLDAGDTGFIMTADRALEPRAHAWLIPGPEAHWAKVAFEKYFLWKMKGGHVTLP